MSLPVLCYHKVGPVATTGRFLNVEAATLRSHCRFFLRRGHQFVLARDLASSSWPAKAVCLTFDDCYTSALENGLPVLEALGVQATWYAVSQRVGQASVWDGDRAAPLAGWDALRELQRLGHEVGNHTATHVHLADETPEAQAAELATCHQGLLAQGLAPGSFCYPYGSVSAQARAAVEAASYQVGLALGKRLAEPTCDRLAVPRVIVAYSDSVPLLAYKLYVRARMRRPARV